MKKVQPHFGLLVTTLFLVIVGIILIYSTSAIYAQERFGDSYYFFKRHLVYSSVALTLLFTCLWIPLDFFKKISFPFLIFSMLLLILVFIPGIGQSVGIASRWLKIGAFRFQPAEIAKLALVFYLSYIITEKDWSQKIFQKLMPHFIIIGIILGCLALQPDFGSVVIFCGLIFLLVFVGGIKFVYVLTSFIAAAPFIYFLALGKAYRRKRLLAFLNPWNDPQNSGYQIIQSYLAFFSGGFLGRGLGEGRSKLFYLPEAHTDFIYASLAEELGFIGALTVLLAFVYMIYVGIRIALRAPTHYLFCLATGITGMIGIEALMNIAVVTGLLPTKGLPLPFISYGGTALIINMVGIGILLNISQNCEAQR